MNLERVNAVPNVGQNDLCSDQGNHTSSVLSRISESKTTVISTNPSVGKEITSSTTPLLARLQAKHPGEDLLEPLLNHIKGEQKRFLEQHKTLFQKPALSRENRVFSVAVTIIKDSVAQGEEKNNEADKTVESQIPALPLGYIELPVAEEPAPLLALAPAPAPQAAGVRSAAARAAALARNAGMSLRIDRQPQPAGEARQELFLERRSTQRQLFFDDE